MSDAADTLYWQVNMAGLPTPHREFKFHPTRRWRFDLAFVDAGLLVDVQGATWAQGKHTRGNGYENDCEKMAEAMLMGFRVLWVTSGMVNDGRALALVERAING